MPRKAPDERCCGGLPVLSGPPFPATGADLDALAEQGAGRGLELPEACLAVPADRVWPPIRHCSEDDLLLLSRGASSRETGYHLYLFRGRFQWRLSREEGARAEAEELWCGRIVGLFCAGPLLHLDRRFWGRHWLSTESLVLVAVCLVDMLSTLGLWSIGLIQEGNPALAHWLEQGVGHFVFVKLFSFVPAVCFAEYLTPLRPRLFRPLLRWVIYFYVLVWGLGLAPVLAWYLAGAPPLAPPP